MTDETRNQASIENWLIQRIGEYETAEATDVTAATPLAEVGFSSVYALTLCGDIEDQYGVEVEPTLLWDQETLGDLARTLVPLVLNAR